jgi:hypothetical protein
MNNYKNIFRFAKDYFRGIGPYGWLMNKVYEKEGKTSDDVKVLSDLLYSKERWSNHVYSGKINSVLSKYPVFEEYGCFSTFKAQRPGPWDDPLMKQNLIKRFGRRLELGKMKFRKTMFGFDSEQQMNNWFDDPYEIKILKEFGFDIYKERVKTSDIVFGLKQVWVLEGQINPNP